LIEDKTIVDRNHHKHLASRRINWLPAIAAVAHIGQAAAISDKQCATNAARLNT
jgi:hypothetical protein